MVAFAVADQIETIIYCFAASIALIAYLKTGKRMKLWLALLPLCFMAEISVLTHVSSVIYLVNLADGIPISTHLSYAPLRVVIYTAILFLDLMILLELLRKSWKNAYLLILLPALAAYIVLAALPETKTVIWLFYGIRQFYRFGYIAALGIAYLRGDERLKHRISSILTPISIVIVFNFSILIEDTMMISNIDSVVSNLPFMSERNVTENCLWIYLSLYFAVQSYRAIFDGRTAEPAALPAPAAPSQEDELAARLSAFASDCRLTSREEEVLGCLISCRNTNEICEELHVALGTVKSHIHNIYSKANVTNKSELIKAVMDFSVN